MRLGNLQCFAPCVKCLRVNIDPNEKEHEYQPLNTLNYTIVNISRKTRLFVEQFIWGQKSFARTQTGKNGWVSDILKRSFLRDERFCGCFNNCSPLRAQRETRLNITRVRCFSIILLREPPSSLLIGTKTLIKQYKGLGVLYRLYTSVFYINTQQPSHLQFYQIRRALWSVSRKCEPFIEFRLQLIRFPFQFYSSFFEL